MAKRFRRSIETSPVVGWHRRVITGAAAPEEIYRYGVEAGRADALAKQPSNWEAALIRTAHAFGESGPGAGAISALTKTLFRKGYLEGYGDGMATMEAIKPGAQAELMLVNMQEGLKIDRNTQPEEFAAWEKAQAAKIHGMDTASVTAALSLGLAALSGVAPKGKAATTGQVNWRGAFRRQSIVGAAESAEAALEAALPPPTSASPASASAPSASPSNLQTAGSMIASLAWTAAAGASTYHGYKRNDGAFGGTALWFLGGIFVPIITVPLALAQGFGKRKQLKAA